MFSTGTRTLFLRMLQYNVDFPLQCALLEKNYSASPTTVVVASSRDDKQIHEYLHFPKCTASPLRKDEKLNEKNPLQTGSYN